MEPDVSWTDPSHIAEQICKIVDSETIEKLVLVGDFINPEVETTEDTGLEVFVQTGERGLILKQRETPTVDTGPIHGKQELYLYINEKNVILADMDSAIDASKIHFVSGNRPTKERQRIIRSMYQGLFFRLPCPGD